MKLLFLDLEGVLNSTSFWLKGHPAPGVNSPYASFDPDAIALLNMIISKTNAEIVLASSLRIYTNKNLTKYFYGIGINGRLNGILSGKYETERIYNRENFKAKGKEVAEYINDYQNNIDNWCIIDDEENEYLETQKNHLIKTDYKHGLTYELAMKAIEILK